MSEWKTGDEVFVESPPAQRGFYQWHATDASDPPRVWRRDSTGKLDALKPTEDFDAVVVSNQQIQLTSKTQKVWAEHTNESVSEMAAGHVDHVGPREP